MYPLTLRGSRAVSLPAGMDAESALRALESALKRNATAVVRTGSAITFYCPFNYGIRRWIGWGPCMLAIEGNEAHTLRYSISCWREFTQFVAAGVLLGLVIELTGEPTGLWAALVAVGVILHRVTTPWFVRQYVLNVAYVAMRESA